MRVALVGSSGYISEYIFKEFSAIHEIESILKLDKNAVYDEYLDLAEAEKFNYSLLDEIDYLVLTAAISSPDKCANEFEKCWKVNVTGTKYFICEAIKHGCRVLFFSSDSVFGNGSGMIFDEKSITLAETPYGRMKKAVEDEFKDDQLFKAIRLSYVASAKDRFYTYCLNCMRTGKVADIYHPFYRNVISISDVVNVVAFFAFHWNEYEPTFLNVAGIELVSRVRMADELNRHFNNKLKYTITIPDEGFFENRPQITQMKSLYMQAYNIIPNNTFTEKIAKELEEIKI